MSKKSEIWERPELTFCVTTFYDARPEKSRVVIELFVLDSETTAIVKVLHAIHIFETLAMRRTSLVGHNCYTVVFNTYKSTLFYGTPISWIVAASRDLIRQDRTV